MKIKLPWAVIPDRPPTDLLCEECEVQYATLKCYACEQVLCERCMTFAHPNILKPHDHVTRGLIHLLESGDRSKVAKIDRIIIPDVDVLEKDVGIFYSANEATNGYPVAIQEERFPTINEDGTKRVNKFSTDEEIVFLDAKSNSLKRGRILTGIDEDDTQPLNTQHCRGGINDGKSVSYYRVMELDVGSVFVPKAKVVVKIEPSIVPTDRIERRKLQEKMIREMNDKSAQYKSIMSAKPSSSKGSNVQLFVPVCIDEALTYKKKRSFVKTQQDDSNETANDDKILMLPETVIFRSEEGFMFMNSEKSKKIKAILQYRLTKMTESYMSIVWTRWRYFSDNIMAQQRHVACIIIQKHARRIFYTGYLDVLVAIDEDVEWDKWSSLHEQFHYADPPTNRYLDKHRDGDTVTKKAIKAAISDRVDQFKIGYKSRILLWDYQDKSSMNRQKCNKLHQLDLMDCAARIASDNLTDIESSIRSIQNLNRLYTINQKLYFSTKHDCILWSTFQEKKVCKIVRWMTLRCGSLKHAAVGIWKIYIDAVRKEQDTALLSSFKLPPEDMFEIKPPVLLETKHHNGSVDEVPVDASDRLIQFFSMMDRDANKFADWKTIFCSDHVHPDNEVTVTHYWHPAVGFTLRHLPIIPHEEDMVGGNEAIMKILKDDVSEASGGSEWSRKHNNFKKLINRRKSLAYLGERTSRVTQFRKQVSGPLDDSLWIIPEKLLLSPYPTVGKAKKSEAVMHAAARQILTETFLIHPTDIGDGVKTGFMDHAHGVSAKFSDAVSQMLLSGINCFLCLMTSESIDKAESSIVTKLKETNQIWRIEIENDDGNRKVLNLKERVIRQSDVIRSVLESEIRHLTKFAEACVKELSQLGSYNENDIRQKLTEERRSNVKSRQLEIYQGLKTAESLTMRLTRQSKFLCFPYTDQLDRPDVMQALLTQLEMRLRCGEKIAIFSETHIHGPDCHYASMISSLLLSRLYSIPSRQSIDIIQKYHNWCCSSCNTMKSMTRLPIPVIPLLSSAVTVRRMDEFLSSTTSNFMNGTVTWSDSIQLSQQNQPSISSSRSSFLSSSISTRSVEEVTRRKLKTKFLKPIEGFGLIGEADEPSKAVKPSVSMTIGPNLSTMPMVRQHGSGTTKYIVQYAKHPYSRDMSNMSSIATAESKCDSPDTDEANFVSRRSLKDDNHTISTISSIFPDMEKALRFSEEEQDIVEEADEQDLSQYDLQPVEELESGDRIILKQIPAYASKSDSAKAFTFKLVLDLSL